MCRAPPADLVSTQLQHALPKLTPTPDENLKSAIICVCGMGAFVATDALGKVLVTVLGMPVLQMLALRGVGMVLVHGAVVTHNGLGRVAFTPRDGIMLVGRVILEALASWLFNCALMHLPMAMATAVVQALPLTVMLGAAVLGEPIGRTGWLLALLGFVGVLVIVHPTAEGIDLWSLSALLAVVCMATRDLITRSLGSRVPSSVAALAGSIGLTMFSAGGSWLQSETWHPLGWPEWSCLVGAALTASIALLSSVSLMRLGSIAFVRARLRPSAPQTRTSPSATRVGVRADPCPAVFSAGPAGSALPLHFAAVGEPLGVACLLRSSRRTHYRRQHPPRGCGLLQRPAGARTREDEGAEQRRRRQSGAGE